MGCEVYANNNEIACKAGGNKVIADMPDVCLSPPSPPAGPVPVPYPATSFSKDMKNGSKTVKIKGKEVMLKDKSFYKTSPLGDEAATRSFGGNLVSHVITGKTYFIAWSMDVKFECKNVDRHLDMTMSNNASSGGTTAPGSSLAEKTQAKLSEGTETKTPDESKCNNEHQWECNKMYCSKCWEPPCPDNAEQGNKEYEETQSGSQEERVKAKHAQTQEMINTLTDKNHIDGFRWESSALQKIIRGGEKIEHIAYMAHCTVCCFKQEVDLVTETAVIEAKRTEGAVELDQMQSIKSIRDQCFKDKILKIVTQHKEMAKIEKKVNTPTHTEWRKAMGPKKVTVEDP